MTDKGRESILVIEIPQKDQNLEGVHENDLKGIAIKKNRGVLLLLFTVFTTINLLCLRV